MTATPASAAQSTATLVDDIIAYVTKFVSLGGDKDADAKALVIALWILHTWTFSPEVPHPFSTPYLYIYSAEKRSGKTRLLEVMETITRNPLRAADVTNAVLFRTIEQNQSTMMIDEVDAIWSGAKNEDLRGTLNVGYKRGGQVPRVERGEVRQFNVFAPKALAGIDNAMLPDTVRDRSIGIHMHRQPVGESTPFYYFQVETEADALCARINEWVKTEWPKLALNIPSKPIDGISDRAWEIVLPLVMIAHGFHNLNSAARKAIKTLLSDDADEKLSPQARLLSDIRDMFKEAGDPATMASADIISKLNGDDGKGGWNEKLLSNKLRVYGPKSQSIRRGNRVMRGYRRADFEDAWNVYLS